MSQPTDPPPARPANPYDEADKQFLDNLTAVCEDRGQRAALRRWWSRGTQTQAFPVLGRLQAIGNIPRTLTAALYAEHPYHSESARSIGQTCLRLEDDAEAYEAHFRRLLSSGDLEEIGDQLHRAIKRASRKGALLPVNYFRLLKDLTFWRDYQDRVKTRWARDFWQAPQGEMEDAGEPTTETNATA